MNKCPKCGSREISGPRYEAGRGCVCHNERLMYVCLDCGYQESRPTLDSTAPHKEKPTS